MKRNILCFILTAAVLLPTVSTAAATDERGVFGGVSQGVPLPKTTEQMLAQTNNTRRGNYTMDYSEMVFLTGKPLRFDGTLTVTQNGGVSDVLNQGTYTVSYTVEPSANTTELVQINREMTLRVNYRKVIDSGIEQVILDYNIADWEETITTGENAFVLDPERSYFGRSIIEDITPGVKYYKGYTSVNAYYMAGADETVRVSQSGAVYGYDCPWSKTETERLDIVVEHNSGWQLEAQVRPSVSVNKLIQYSPNEPTAISFDGNYYEVTANRSVLAYNIYRIPLQFERGTQLSGSITVPNVNRFEMLPAPNLAFLKGHFAESDIQKLFAMQIFSGEPTQFQPSQAMTRAQFATALVKAFKIPIELPQSTGSGNRKTITVLFPDVQSTRSDFPFLMAAYKYGIAYGRHYPVNDNRFRPDEAITMEEAITMIMRGIGLENLGLTPTTVTVFADDAQISDWAKREVSAAHTIGIIGMDANGRLNPKKKLTKAEGAALVNNMIDYMRSGLPVDYVEHILNFAN